jgi:hypothetical protein
VPALPACGAEQLEHDAAVRAASEIVPYLQEQRGRRLAAHLVGLGDTRQIARYACPDGPQPSAVTERGVREDYRPTGRRPRRKARRSERYRRAAGSATIEVVAPSRASWTTGAIVPPKRARASVAAACRMSVPSADR